MKTFFKYFFTGLGFQVLIVIISILAGLGDLIFLPYWIPLSLFDAVIDIPDDFGQRYGLIGFALLCAIPAIFYSSVFALIICALKRAKKFR